MFPTMSRPSSMGRGPIPTGRPIISPTTSTTARSTISAIAGSAVPIILPLWGWDHWDWRDHRIDIDRDRFTQAGSRPPADRRRRLAARPDPSERRPLSVARGARAVPGRRSSRIGFAATADIRRPAPSASAEQRGSRIAAASVRAASAARPAELRILLARARMRASRPSAARSSRMSAPSYRAERRNGRISTRRHAVIRGQGTAMTEIPPEA